MSALLELIIHARYRDGTKAAEFFSTNSSKSVTQLLDDLEQLKFPTPKESNISFVSVGCMRASWICSFNSPLYKRIKMLVYRTKSPSFTQFWGSSTPASLEIAWITLIEKPIEEVNILPDDDTCTAALLGSDKKTKMKRVHTIDEEPNNADTVIDSFSVNSTTFTDQSNLTNVGRPGVRPLLPTTDKHRLAPLEVSEALPQLRNKSVTSQTTSQLTAHALGVPISRSLRRTSVGSKAHSQSSSRGKDVHVLQKNRSDEHLPLFLCQRSEGFEESFPDGAKTADFERQLANERAVRARLETTCSRVQRALDTTRAALGTVDDELKREQEKCVTLEVELANERRKRQEAENVLKDVERECRTPFVVPAMLDAFCMVSKLTNRTMDTL